MRLLTLNIQHTAVVRADHLAEAILAESPDVVFLTEVSPGAGTDRLVGRLGEAGLTFGHAGLVGPEDLPYTVSVSSRLELGEPRFPFADSRFTQAALEVELDGATLTALYFPLNRSRPRTRDHDDFWEQAFRPYADSLAGRPAILAGDWNTGSRALDIAGGRVPGMAQFDDLVASGWIDAWRSRHPGIREFSWHHLATGNGFRLDHALVSPAMAPALIGARYIHATRTRAISDHAALLVDIDLPVVATH